MKKETKRNNAAPKSHTSHKAKSKENLSPLSQAMKNSVLGFLLTLPVCVLLIFLSALISLKSPDPDSLVRPLAVASLIVSFLTCGFLSGKLNSRSTLLCSAVSGGAFILLIMLASLLVGKNSCDTFSASQRALLYLGAFASSLVGGFLSSLKRKVRHKTPKRR